MKKPTTTLFMMMSVDGKISTGDSDILDFDQDLPNVIEVKEGIQQYYDLEQETDLVSLNSGRVFAKIGFNDKEDIPEKTPVAFVVIDNKPHLNEKGMRYLSQKANKVILVTTNKEHSAYTLKEELENITVVEYKKNVDLENLFSRLKDDFGVGSMTIQSGGTLNAEFIRKGLVDFLSIVVAPVVVGGKDTSTLVDGESLHSLEDLKKLKVLELQSVDKLKDSYLHLKYKVIN